MPSFTEPRNIELSWIHYLTTQINASWSDITIVKSFSQAYKSSMPVVAIRLRPIQHIRKEIGSIAEWNEYTISIDIFAESDGQRIDLAYFIAQQINSGCTYYEHSQTSGAPETLSRVDNGYCILKSFYIDTPLDFGEEGVDRYDKYRHVIEFITKKS